MYKWSFELNGSPVAVETVIGWNDITSSYTFDGKYIRIPTSGEITLCGGTAYDDFSAVDPCGDHQFTIFYDCGTGPSEFTTLHVQQKDISFDCEKCTVTLKLSDGNLLAEMEEVSGDEICFFARDDFFPRQVITWGEFQYNARTWHVEELLDAMLKKQAPNAQVVANSFGTGALNYQPEIHEVATSAISAGQTAVLTLVNQFDSQYVITINGAATADEVAERIGKALMCVDATGNGFVNMTPDEIVNRIQKAEWTGNILTIQADYSFTCELDTNGVITNSVETQPFVYGLEQLRIKPPGLRRNLCISWETLVSAIQCLTPTIIKDGPTTIQFLDANRSFASADTITTDGVGLRKRGYDDTWLKSSYLLTHEFSVEDYEASQAAWVWSGNLVNVTGIHSSPYTYTGLSSTLLNVVDGELCFTNNNSVAALVTVALQVNNGSGWNTAALLPLQSLSPGQDFCYEFGENANVSFPTFCVEPGDQIRFLVTAELFGTAIPVLLPTSSDLTLSFDISCFDAPNFDPDEHQSDLFSLSKTICCGKQNTCKVPKEINVDLGYAISETIMGLQEYRETFFMLLADPSNPELPMQFERRFFFDDTDLEACECWRGTIQPVYYYNILLQRLHVAYQKRAIIPSAIGYPGFSFEAEVSDVGVITCEVFDRESEMEEGLGMHGYDTYTFTKCIDVEDFVNYALGAKLQIDDAGCVGCTGEGTIQSMEFKPSLSGNGTTEITVLMKCSTFDTSICETEEDPFRGIQVDDEDMFSINVTTDGSLSGGVDISDDSGAEFCDTLCLTDKNRAGNVIRRVPLLTVCYNGAAGGNTTINSITYLYPIAAGDQALINAEISGLVGDTGISLNKWNIDTILKGSNFSFTGSYALTENTAGKNYLQEMGWPVVVDVDGSPHLEGAYWEIKGTVTAGGNTSSPNVEEARRSIKRFKNSSLLVRPTTTGISPPPTYPGDEIHYDYLQIETDPYHSFDIPGGISRQPSLTNNEWWQLEDALTTIDDADGTGPQPLGTTNPVIEGPYVPSPGTHPFHFTGRLKNGMVFDQKCSFDTFGSPISVNTADLGYMDSCILVSFGLSNVLIQWVVEGINWQIHLFDQATNNYLLFRNGTPPPGPVNAFLQISNPYVNQKWTSWVRSEDSAGNRVDQDCEIWITETV